MTPNEIVKLTLLTIAIFLLMTCIPQVSQADPEFELTLLLTSDHYDDGEYNEQHNGIGFTMHEGGTSPYSHTAMFYKNSLDKNSLSYSLHRRFGCYYHLCAGGAIVAATGYDYGLAGNIAVVPFLTISIGPVRSMHLPGVVSAYGLGIPLGEDQ